MAIKSVTIDLTSEEEAHLCAAARSQGVEPKEYARRLLAGHLCPTQPGAGTRALFARWDAEDATDDPAEITARAQEWEELKAGLDANRAGTGEPPLFQ